MKHAESGSVQAPHFQELLNKRASGNAETLTYVLRRYSHELSGSGGYTING
jgi:hypothetical protein